MESQEQRILKIIGIHAGPAADGQVDRGATFKELGISSLKMLVIALEVEGIVGRPVVDILAKAATPADLLSALAH